MVYAEPVTIDGDTNIIAYAVTFNYLDDAFQSTLLTLPQAAVPAFSPSPGLYTNGTLVSLSTTTSNVIIRYNVDGSDPNTSSNVFTYSGPFSFTNPMILTARAYHSEMDPSGEQSAYYSLFQYEKTVVTTFAGSTTAGFSNAVG